MMREGSTPCAAACSRMLASPKGGKRSSHSTLRVRVACVCGVCVFVVCVAGTESRGGGRGRAGHDRGQQAAVSGMRRGACAHHARRRSDGGASTRAAPAPAPPSRQRTCRARA
jgi:hypothetical protein